jgi:hypothetical protein
VINLRLDRSGALLLNYCKLGKSWDAEKLFASRARNMPLDSREVATEELRHLQLGQPRSIAITRHCDKTPTRGAPRVTFAHAALACSKIVWLAIARCDWGYRSGMVGP